MLLTVSSASKLNSHQQISSYLCCRKEYVVVERASSSTTYISFTSTTALWDPGLLATKQQLMLLDSNCMVALLLKLDFRNAFNTLTRDKMLESVKDHAPELFSFIHAAYGEPSLLFCGQHTLLSAEGVQQGDPLGPFFFCLTIQLLVLQL